MEAKLCRFNQAAQKASQTSLKVLYEHTVFAKRRSILLWPQNSPGKMDTHARYLHYHNELELGWCTEGSGIIFVEDKVIPFQAPCASVIYQGQIHIAQSNPDKPAKWYFINVDECILSAKDDESLTAGHIGAPILDDSTAEGRDILTLVQMVVDELQAKRPGSRQCAEWLVRSILYKHARLSDHRQVAPWRLAEVSPAVTYVSNPLCRALPDRNAGTALQYERIDPASKILQRIGMRAFRLYPPRPHRSGNGNAFRRE